MMISTSWRRARRIRPGCESLEGRDLQAVAFVSLSLGRVALNPQPLPPRSIAVSPLLRVALNPQPLPPRY